MPQASSGLLAVLDNEGEKGQLTYDSSIKKLSFKLGAVTLLSPVLSFAANADVEVAIGYDDDDGIFMTYSINGGAPVHVNGAGPRGTNADVWTSLRVGEANGLFSNGVMDNAQIFERGLTQSERADLMQDDTPLGGLPDPEATLLWYAPFDADPVLDAGSLSAGIVTENAADENGLTKGVCVLRSDIVQQPSAVGVAKAGTRLEAGAFIAINAGSSQDTLPVAHQQQFATAWEQQTRVR
jgi:hypothetical protein